MTPIDKFIEDWINGQVRKFRAEIEEWDDTDCRYCNLEADECGCQDWK